MSIIPRQIGEDPQTQMLRIISNQLDRITKVISQLTVTITTTVAP